MLRLLLLRGPGAAGWAARYTGGYWSISGSPGHYTVGNRLLHGVLCPGRGSRPIHASASRLLLPALSHRLSARSVSATGGGSAPGQESGGASGKQATDPVDGEKKPNKSQQLKKVFKEYGAVGVSFHVGISLMSLGIFYLIVSSGVDITAVLLKLGFSEAVVQSRMAAGTSTFVLAYAIHKLFAPVRMSITVVSVPFIVRYFRKIGFFKPPAPKP